MADTPAVTVRHEPDAHRFVADLDGEEAVAEYWPDGRTVTFTHTEVPPAFEGRGVGSALARAALDHARAEGLEVVPQCPFILAWVKRHRDYHDLVQAEWRDRMSG